MTALHAFTHDSPAQRVIYGPGKRHDLAAEAKRMNLARLLVLSTPEQRSLAEGAAHDLGPLCAGIHDQAVMHVPLATAQKGIALSRELNADGYVAIGGGSTIGLAKAIARETRQPIIAIPTTYAGSEMTPLYGITSAGEKLTGRDPNVLPRVTIYDPELTLTLPSEMSALSGLNAIAHAAEALYAPDASPIHLLCAEEGIRALSDCLPKLIAAPDDLDLRGRAQYGTWLCGMVLGQVTMGLHHKICHVLGGSFNLPHAETHATILPYVLALNAPAAPGAMAAISRATGHADGLAGLAQLYANLPVPSSLAALGLQAEDLTKASSLICARPYPNPRATTEREITRLLGAAYQGKASGSLLACAH